MRILPITSTATENSMYICICNAVTEQEIRLAIARGAANLTRLRRDLGVGARCGKCKAHARGLVQEQSRGEASEEIPACQAG